MKIRWNWGTGIFLGMFAMIGFIVFLVVKTFDSKINKVSDDYYERGLDHSAQMRKIENSLQYQPDFKVIHTDVCTVQFPSFFNGKKLDGKILFFRPSDYSKDLEFDIKLDSLGKQLFPIDHFYKGKYIVKSNFKCDETDYYLETNIIF